ncbi:ABC transporter permease [Paenibacillus sp. HN-1]|uniref:ABC transporter permease n=1 Tax=Paenibacillus TaxID=44249 RepID=UPI001CA807F9|nr:ABC transporter permease [Paenibacillus sp. CGMCC 1.18879]MBY9078367.1 ABC transporter permease [Paenibacillus sp. CGMCC 1.18879]MBY9087300.1 ABC transporter permease [Paenibacillus sinensis]
MNPASFSKTLTRYGPFLLLLILIAALWEGAVRTGHVPPFILPAPSSVWFALRDNAGLLLRTHLPATLTETVIGCLLSVLGGILLGTAMHLSRMVEQALYPFIVISQTIPLIALSPLFIMWFGYSMWSKVAVVFLTAFFPIVVGVYDGLRRSGGGYRDLLLTMGASHRQLLLKVGIPLALPSFFSGLRLCVVYCVIGATIGEWLGGTVGLGYYSRRMAGSLHSAEMFAAIFLLSAMGLVLFLAVRLLEFLILRKRGSLQ